MDAAGPHLRHHASGGQLLVQLLVDAAHRRAQVALAQLDQHQVHFRRQLAAGKGLVDGHAQVFGADRVVVGIQLGAADQVAQAPVQPRQHRLEVAQQHGGEITHRQPRFQYMFGQQAQAIFGRTGQGRLGRQRLAAGERVPSPLQMAGEGTGDVPRRRRSSRIASRNSSCDEPALPARSNSASSKRASAAPKTWHSAGRDHVPGTLQLDRVTTRRSHRCGRAHHSGRLPTSLVRQSAWTSRRRHTPCTGTSMVGRQPVTDSETVLTSNLMTGAPARWIS